MKVYGKKMKTIHVLLIEDDEDDFILTKSILEEIDPNKYQIDWVTNYDDAVAAIRLITHDVCLLDYRLNGNTGLELLNEICAPECAIPIILLTGQTDIEIDLQVMEAGATDYLLKSELNPENLERAIRYAIQQKRIQFQLINLAREKEARQAAEEANHAKDDFLAIVSHELRSPLNAMLGWVKLLRTKKLDEETIERGLETIEKSARTQAKLIDELMDISRIVSGTFQLKISPVNISAVINVAISAIQPVADAKEIEINFSCKSYIEKIEADSDRLQQAMINLLSNAIKFTPENGRVDILFEDDKSESIKIIVKDNGVGIRNEFLSKVFERYRQEETSTTKKNKGLGLGLFIVRQIIELHDGTVRAESDGEGKGASFIITLPVKQKHTKDG